MSGRKRRRWSMKSDSELIELAKSQSLEAIADKIQRPSGSVLKQAARLGLSIIRKAKGK
jgi:CHASE3 domain sensor protein